MIYENHTLNANKYRALDLYKSYTKLTRKRNFSRDRQKYMYNIFHRVDHLAL